MGTLTAAKVRALTAPGRYGDGEGLWLQVREGGRQSWLLRFMIDGRAREMGLGSVQQVGLADAREAAREARRLVKQGVDPLERRHAAQQAQKATKAGTFQEVAESYIRAHEAGWRNPKHRAQWDSTLAAYAYPFFGNEPVQSIETSNVMHALEPIWRARPETASRLRGRIEAVLDFATARGWRTGENPARWRGHLSNLLPSRTSVAPIEHRPALAWQELPAFMAELRGHHGTGPRALEFAILTASRSGEALSARWSEIDLDGAVWTIPGSRMKAGREHRVPLSAAAVGLLTRVKEADQVGVPCVFPGGKIDKPLSDMALTMLLRRMSSADDDGPPRWRDRQGRAVVTHGFRSTFREWCAEATTYPRELAEAALAHTLRDKVEAAYQRSDMLERRRPMMEAWAAHCARPITAGAVVALFGDHQRGGPDNTPEMDETPTVRAIA